MNYKLIDLIIPLVPPLRSRRFENIQLICIMLNYHYILYSFHQNLSETRNPYTLIQQRTNLLTAVLNFVEHARYDLKLWVQRLADLKHAKNRFHF